MKKSVYTFCCCLVTCISYAQHYSFSASVKPYAEVTAPDLQDTTLADYLSFAPDASFKLFGISGVFSYSAGVSTGYLVAANNENGFALDPMMGTRFRKIPGLSSVSVKEIKDSLLVVQWKGIGLHGHADDEFLNFQVKIYLSGRIEYHYGPTRFVAVAGDSVFSDPANTGPEVMLVWLYPDFSNYYEFNSLSGNPSAPVYSKNYMRMNSIPQANQLYTFTPRGVTGLYETALYERAVTVFPNPAAGGAVTISSDAEQITGVKLFNAVGELVMESVGSNRLDLPAGSQLYFAEITLANGVHVVKKIMAP